MSTHKKILDNKLLIGRNEWCQLLELKIPAIKAKIDSGAKTSALHARNIKTKLLNGIDYVHFDINPIQGNSDLVIHCKSPIIDERYIMSSNGHKEHRYVISTMLNIGDKSWDIELTLSNRDPLRYRMLLGREAINNRALIHPAITCNQGKVSNKLLKKIYKER